jgi:tetratricopeptide (TPR) repeat protein
MDLGALKQKLLGVIKHYPMMWQALKRKDEKSFTQQFKAYYPELVKIMHIDDVLNAPDQQNGGKPMSRRGFLGWMSKTALAGATYAILSSPVGAQNVCVNKEEAESLHTKGYHLSVSKRYDDAIVTYKKAITLCPQEGKYYNSLGLNLTYAGKLDEAYDAFRSALKLIPNQSAVHSNLGVYYEKLFDTTGDKSHILKAITSYERAAELNTNPLITKSALRKINELKHRL